MTGPSADRDSAQREREAWRQEATIMMARLCNAADSAERERDEARADPLPLAGTLEEILERATEFAKAEDAPAVRLDHFLWAALLVEYPSAASDMLSVAEEIRDREREDEE